MQLRGEDSGTQQGECWGVRLRDHIGWRQCLPSPRGQRREVSAKEDPFKKKKKDPYLVHLDSGGQDTHPGQPALELSPSNIT